MSLPRPTTDRLSRRSALTGAVTAGIGLPLLAACGSDDTAGATDAASGSSSGGTAPSAAASDGSSAGASGGGTGDALTTTADIEVGGGAIFADEEVVVTQPTAGEFKCFSSICTHQGCPVTSVSKGTINCTCHGSTFSIEDGSPQSGPASKPLSEKSITVTGDQITLA